MRKSTKDQLSDALKTLLETQPLSSITVSDISNECGLSRMTFYYHFKNIHELAEFACNRELDSIIGPVDDENLTWELMFERIGNGFVSHKPFYDAVAMLSSVRGLHRRFIAYCRQILIREVKPAFLEAGRSEDDAADTIEVLSCAIAASLTGWMTGYLDFETARLSEIITGIRNTYLAGVTRVE